MAIREPRPEPDRDDSVKITQIIALFRAAKVDETEKDDRLAWGDDQQWLRAHKEQLERRRALAGIVARTLATIVATAAVTAALSSDFIRWLKSL